MRIYTDDEMKDYYLVKDRFGRVTREYLETFDSWDDATRVRFDPPDQVTAKDSDPRPDQRKDPLGYQRWYRRNRANVAKNDMTSGYEEHTVHWPSDEVYIK